MLMLPRAPRRFRYRNRPFHQQTLEQGVFVPLIVTSLILLLCAPRTFAYSSADYEIPASVVGGSGTSSSSANYSLLGTTSQASVVGNSTSTNYSAGFGYIPQASEVNNPTDMDEDGLADSWEVQNGLDPGDATGENGANGDLDDDGLTNAEEQSAGTAANLADTDSDGVDDAEEIAIGTDPTNAGDDPGPATWIDFQHSGTESGTFSEPFDTMTEGLSSVPGAGTLRVMPGTSTELLVISQSVTVEAVGGLVRLGVVSRASREYSEYIYSTDAPESEQKRSIAETEDRIAATNSENESNTSGSADMQVAGGTGLNDTEDSDSTSAARIGDSNGDGQINSTDALWLIQHEFGLREGPSLDIGDLNGDGLINSTDALWAIQIEFGQRDAPE